MASREIGVMDNRQTDDRKARCLHCEFFCGRGITNCNYRINTIDTNNVSYSTAKKITASERKKTNSLESFNFLVN